MQTCKHSERVTSTDIANEAQNNNKTYVAAKLVRTRSNVSVKGAQT